MTHGAGSFDQCAFLVTAEGVQIAAFEIGHGLKALGRLKVVAVHRLSDGQAVIERDTGGDHGSDIAIILGFDSLQKYFDFVAIKSSKAATCNMPSLVVYVWP